jgi:hypothetical protein
MGKHAVLVAIGLVVGLLAGFVIRGAIKDPVKTAVEPATHELPTGLPDHSDPLLSTACESNKSEILPQGDIPARSAIADLLANADVPEVPSGDGEITGVVLTPDGEAVPGVVVTASGGFPGDRGFLAKTAEERIAARICLERWQELARHKTTTGSDGAYRISGLAHDADYNIGATGEGWSISARDESRYQFRAGDTCDFVAHPVTSVLVRVFMPDGSQATTCRITCTNQARISNEFGPFDGRHTFDLRPGTWRVKARAGKYDELTTNGVEIVVEAGVKQAPVDLHLCQSAGIAGVVKSANPGLARRAKIHLQSNPSAEPPPTSFDDDHRSDSRSDFGNPFSFVGLKPGRYRLLLVFDYRVMDWEDVVVADCLIETTLEMGDPAPDTYIVVRVYDPAGKLVPDANLTICFRSGQGSSSSGGSELKQADGSYWLFKNQVSHDSRMDQDCYYTVSARTGSYGEKEVRYEITDTHEVEIRFGLPAWAKLAVSNFNDHALRDKLTWNLVSAGGEAVNDYAPWREGENEASPFTFGPIEPGEYFVTLHYHENHESRELVRERVALTAGENALSAQVPLLYTLTITSDDEQRLRQLELVEKDGPGRIRARAEVVEGKLTLKCVPPGTYLLKDYKSEMEVTVTCDTTIKFEPRTYDCLVIEVSNRADVDALGFATGDRVIEIDGAKLSDGYSGWTHVQASMVKESTTWKVLRNGVPVEVTFDGRLLAKAFEKGDNGLKLRSGFQTD